METLKKEIPVNGEKILVSLTIELTVKAAALFKKASGGNQPTKDDIDNLTMLDDGVYSSGYGGRKEYFHTDVNRGTEVCWIARVASAGGSDRGYKIILHQVTQKSTPGNVPFFSPMPINAKNDVILGTVLNSVKDNQIDDYDIAFYIQDPNGTMSSLIELDPKLRLDPRRLTELLSI